MKKLMLLAVIAMVLTVFNACTKDELPVDKQSSKKPDVYLENDYLVVKNFGAIDSLKKQLQNKSVAYQQSWENQLGFKSAKSFRVEISDKLASILNYNEAANYANKLAKEGYFSWNDSSLCYPFYNYSWDCILNKSGVIKIGDVLYCFQKDAQIAAVDGKIETLSQFLQNSQNCDLSLIKVVPFEKLKSTTPVNYGRVLENSVSEDGTRFTLRLQWVRITQQVLNVNNQWVTAQVGNKLELYFHHEKKVLFGWSDKRTRMFFKHLSANIGGNYDPIEGRYYTQWINNTPSTGFTELNPSDLANVYLDVYVALFQYYSNVYSSYSGPVIYDYRCQGYPRDLGEDFAIEIDVN